MSRAPWLNPRILYTLLFVFLSGAAAGVLAMKLSAPQQRGGPWWKQDGREISLQRFQKELNLTPEQAKEVERVLDDFMMYYQTLQAQMDDVRATGKGRILKLLNEDQQKKFDKMLGEIQAKQLR